MNESNITILGDYLDARSADFEGALTFSLRAAYIEKKKIWKSKDITAEFLGNFWQNMLLDETQIKSTLHFVCAELMENAVNHSVNSDYLVRIQLCFNSDEILVYVENDIANEQVEELKTFVQTLLETENLQKLFIKRMKEIKKTGGKKSQVGLITIIKDRGAKLSWKIEQKTDETKVTTLARIPLKRKDD